jgi:protein O-GlcNAc transferase
MSEYLEQYKRYFNDSIKAYNDHDFQKAIDIIEKHILADVSLTDYMLIGKAVSVPKTLVEDSLYNVGVYYKEWAESLVKPAMEEKKTTGTLVVMSEQVQTLFSQAMQTFRKVLSIHINHKNSIANIISILTVLSFCNSEDSTVCIKYLQECLLYQPDNPTIHYNLGFIYQKINKVELALIHFRLAISLNTEKESSLLLNCYYGIGNLYTTLKEWPSALHYLIQGLRIRPKDPDINNNLGIVYTEMRRTDLALQAYTTAEENVKSCTVSNNSDRLLANVYLNKGHMHSYDGQSALSIECYNKALQVNSASVLAFQNKMMNLNYFFHDIEDKEFLLKQHKLINKFYKEGNQFTFGAEYFATEKIHIGFVSADFVQHPVSYFINGVCTQLDRSRFQVHVYSEGVIQEQSLPNCALRVIKNATAKQVAALIHKDNIHVLIDLSGHTAGNRLDVFALKPAPIQMTYLGYPNTTGLDAMDYRLTDHIADSSESERYYTEKLLYLEKCFLSYRSPVVPELKAAPFLKNGFVTFGTFNRLNKVTPGVVALWKQLLQEVPNSRILFKTKGLLNKNVRTQFVSQFGELAARIDIVECTTTHEEHIEAYNDMDIAIDTFPYAGTTTTCEALLMGTPVLTVRDAKTHFHAQNVSSSILHHSNLKEYICESPSDVVAKAKELVNKKKAFWKKMKRETRERFLKGSVCDTEGFTRDFERVLQDVFAKAKAKE